MWEETFVRCAVYEKQVQALDRHIKSLQPQKRPNCTHTREQSTGSAPAIDSLRCARDICRFLRNLEIRSYYLRSHLVSKSIGAAPEGTQLC
jgi:hypothetical protein